MAKRARSQADATNKDDTHTHITTTSEEWAQPERIVAMADLSGNVRIVGMLQRLIVEE